MHRWFEGAETLGQLTRTTGFDPDDPGRASTVALERLEAELAPEQLAAARAAAAVATLEELERTARQCARRRAGNLVEA